MKECSRIDGYKVPQPRYEKLCRIEILLEGDCYELGDIGTGVSEVTPVTGGYVTGKISGELMPFGADWGLLHSESVNVLDTKLMLKTVDGVYISIETKGILLMDLETMDRGRNGEDIEDYYFRMTLSFKTGAPRYRWLNAAVTFGVCIITDDGNVCMDVYKLI